MPKKPTPEEIAAFVNSFDSVSPDIDSDDVPVEDLLAYGEEAEAEFEGRGLEAAALGAAGGLTGGVSDVLLTGTTINGKPIYTKEELSRVYEENQGAALAGEVGGLIPNLGFGAILRAAGKGAEKVVAKKIGEKLGKEIPKSLKQRITRKVISEGTIGAVEGGLYGIKQTLTEDAVGSAEANAENLAANMGLGAVLGGGAGALIGVASAVPRQVKTAKKLGVSLDDLSKGPSSEVVDAARRQGIDITVGMRSGNEVLKGMEETLASKHSIFTRSVRRDVEGVIDNVQNKADELLKNTSSQAKVDVGQGIKDRLSDSIDEVHDQFGPWYKKLESEGVAIEVESEAVERIARRLEKPRSGLEAGGPYEKILQAEAASLRKQTTFTQLEGAVKRLNSDISKAVRAGDGGTAEILQSVKKTIVRLQEKALDKSIQKTGNAELAATYRAEKKAISKKYAEFKEWMGQVSDVGGIGGGGSYTRTSKALEKMKPEAIVEKMFNPNNMRSTRFFKEKFPDLFEDARRSKLQELYNKALEKNATTGLDELRVKKFFSEFDKRMRENPEAATLLYGADKLAQLSDLSTLTRALPKNPNPSGSAIELSMRGLLGLLGVDDIAKMVIYRNSENAVIRKTIGGLETSKNAVSQVLDGAASALVSGAKKAGASEYRLYAAAGTSLLTGKPDDKGSLEKNVSARADEVNQLLENPEKIAELVSDLGASAPRTQEAMGAQIYKSLQYLQVHAPVSPMHVVESPINRGWLPSRVVASEYAKLMDAVFTPLSTIKRLSSGVYTMAEVNAVKELYPNLHAQLVDNISANIMASGTKPKYSTLVSLSQLTGVPYTEEMNGLTVAGLQRSWMSAESEAPQAGGGQPQQQSRRNVEMDDAIRSNQSGVERVAGRV